MSMIWFVAPAEEWAAELSEVLSGLFAVRRITGLRSLTRLLRLGEAPASRNFLCLIHFKADHDLMEVHSVLCACLIAFRSDQICVVGDLNNEQKTVIKNFLVPVIDFPKNPTNFAKQLRQHLAKIGCEHGSNVSERTIRIGDIEVDRESALMRVLATGFEEALTPKEIRILQVLAMSANKTIARDELVQKVWAGVRVSTSTIDSHMSRLRRKIEQSFECRLETEYGSGWRIAVRSQFSE